MAEVEYVEQHEDSYIMSVTDTDYVSKTVTEEFMIDDVVDVCFEVEDSSFSDAGGDSYKYLRVTRPNGDGGWEPLTTQRGHPFYVDIDHFELYVRFEKKDKLNGKVTDHSLVKSQTWDKKGLYYTFDDDSHDVHTTHHVYRQRTPDKKGCYGQTLEIEQTTGHWCYVDAGRMRIIKKIKSAISYQKPAKFVHGHQEQNADALSNGLHITKKTADGDLPAELCFDSFDHTIYKKVISDDAKSPNDHPRYPDYFFTDQYEFVKKYTFKDVHHAHYTDNKRHDMIVLLELAHRHTYHHIYLEHSNEHPEFALLAGDYSDGNDHHQDLYISNVQYTWSPEDGHQ